MKSNVFDIRTKERVAVDVPRNTLPGGIFMSLNNLVSSIEIEGPRCFLVGALREYVKQLRVPSEDLRTLVFIFDSKNSRAFLVKDLRDKADAIFEDQVMFEWMIVWMSFSWVIRL